MPEPAVFCGVAFSCGKGFAVKEEPADLGLVLRFLHTQHGIDHGVDDGFIARTKPVVSVEQALFPRSKPALSFLRILYAEKLRQADLQCSADRRDQVDVGP